MSHQQPATPEVPAIIDPANVQNYPRKYIDEIERLRLAVIQLQSELETALAGWHQDQQRRDAEQARAAEAERRLAALCDILEGRSKLIIDDDQASVVRWVIKSPIEDARAALRPQAQVDTGNVSNEISVEQATRALGYEVEQREKAEARAAESERRLAAVMERLAMCGEVIHELRMHTGDDWRKCKTPVCTLNSAALTAPAPAGGEAR